MLPGVPILRLCFSHFCRVVRFALMFLAFRAIFRFCVDVSRDSAGFCRFRAEAPRVFARRADFALRFLAFAPDVPISHCGFSRFRRVLGRFEFYRGEFRRKIGNSTPEFFKMADSRGRRTWGPLYQIFRRFLIKNGPPPPTPYKISDMGRVTRIRRLSNTAKSKIGRVAFRRALNRAIAIFVTVNVNESWQIQNEQIVRTGKMEF